MNEVFLEVSRNAGRFEARSQASTWILAFARYKTLASLRRRSCDKLDDEACARLEDPADDAEASVQKTETEDRTQRPLARMLQAICRPHIGK